MTLQPNQYGKLFDGPLLLVIMDGVGEGPAREDNAVQLAHTPHLDRLREGGLWRLLKAHGKAVGLPSDKDMGNSEVGHNALGAGRVYAQGAKLVEDAIQEGSLFTGDAWKELVGAASASADAALHFIGLLSDGNVHSHERHLHAMIKQAADAGVTKLFVHMLTDGRDVSERSALEYVERLEGLLGEYHGAEGRDYRIASGGGRMVITMDRYEAEWDMVERGWKTHVHGEGRQFPSAKEAIQTYYEEEDVNDQHLPAFVIADDSGPVAPIQDGDAVVFFNFRGDRAIEISRAFTEEDFAPFDRGRRPDVTFAGMMQYDGDLGIPARFLVTPPTIEGSLSAYLVEKKIRQYAISETQKYGHVTYFWNGNRSGKFDDDLETYVEVPGDPQPFEQRPWMKAAQITDKTIEAMASGSFDFLRLNFPNGDMVGHTGSLEAAILSVSTVDLCVGRLLKVIEKLGGAAVITADHGNADEMWETDKAGHFRRDEAGNPRLKTSHSLRPVPFAVFCPLAKHRLRLATLETAGLSNMAATLLTLLGYEAPEGYDPSLLEVVEG